MFDTTSIYPNVKGNINISLSEDMLNKVLTEHEQQLDSVPREGESEVTTTITADDGELVITSKVKSSYY